MDEYTGEELEHSLITEAIVHELIYFNENVWHLTTAQEASKIPGAVIVGGRWVLCNKGDLTKPKMRARYVATEVNKSHDDAFYASTPPLEALKLLFVKYSQMRKAKGSSLKISVMDATKAYFNAKPTRDIFVRVPREMGMPPGTVGKLVRCCYGTRDAGSLWEETYASVLTSLGFRRGRAPP